MRNDVAGFLVIATLAGAVLVEWAVTFRERETTRGVGRLRAASVLGEVTLLRTGERRDEDRNTKWILLGGALIAFALAVLAEQHLTRLAFERTGWLPTIVGVVVMWAGIILRAWAIVTLGRFFRRDIQVAVDQVVVDTGPYAVVRHPAYTGNLVLYAGVGIVLANWASLAIMLIVPLLALLPRIRAEDALMIEKLGEPYREYADRTPRLLPGIW